MSDFESEDMRSIRIVASMYMEIILIMHLIIWNYYVLIAILKHQHIDLRILCLRKIVNEFRREAQ